MGFKPFEPLVWQRSDFEDLPLHLAAFEGDVQKVEELLLQGADANGEEGMSPLHLAAWNDHSAVVNLLLDWQADIHARTDFVRFDGVEYRTGLSPLHAAAMNDSLAAATILVERGAQIEARYTIPRDIDDDYTFTDVFTPLLVAAAIDSPSIATLLLDAGASMRTTKLGHKDRPTSTALHVAARNNSQDVAELLLDRGADIESHVSYGFEAAEYRGTHGTALHQAVVGNSMEVATLLLDRGADIEAIAGQFHLFFRGLGGREFIENLTTLHLASMVKIVPMVELLLDRGANLDAKGPHGMTPLQVAVYYRPPHWETRVLRTIDGTSYADDDLVPTVELLLDRGANIEAVGANGETALHLAVQANHPAVTEFLIERGADRNVVDGNGLTPCQQAREQEVFGGTPLLGRLCAP